MTYVREHNPWVDSSGHQVKATTMNGIDAALTTLFGVAPATNGAMVWDGTQFRADAGIKNVNVDAAAAIARSKLDFGSGLVNADIAAAAAIVYSKLNLGTSIVNADIAATAAIAFSKIAGPALTTTFPGSPTDGQVIAYTDNTGTPTYVWLMQWINAISRWIFLGGSPAVSSVATAETTASTTYAALTTPGPSFALPRAGSYEITIGCESHATANTNESNSYMSYDIGGTGAVDADALAYMSEIAASGFHNPAYGGSRTQVKTGLTAVTLTAKYRNGAASDTVSFSQRQMTVRPVVLS